MWGRFEAHFTPIWEGTKEVCLAPEFWMAVLMLDLAWVVWRSGN